MPKLTISETDYASSEVYSSEKWDVDDRKHATEIITEDLEETADDLFAKIVMERWNAGDNAFHVRNGSTSYGVLYVYTP